MKLEQVKERAKAEESTGTAPEFVEAISLLAFCAFQDHEQLQEQADPELQDDNPESWGFTIREIAAEYLNRSLQ